MTSLRYLVNFLQCNILRHSSTSSSKSKLRHMLLTMPREKAHLDTIRKQRIKMKEQRKRFAPGCLYLQVLGSGARGTPRSLYVFTDQSRCLFNCSEGTQRLALEHKCKLAKLEHIFVTSPRWENIGGLPGMALSAQDVGVPRIVLHGPEGIDEIFEATKKFVVLRSLEVTRAEPKNDTYEDDIMTVRYVRLKNERAESEGSKTSSDDCEQNSDSDTDYYSHEINTSTKRLKTENGAQSLKSKRKFSDLSRKRISDAITYICKLQPRAGALLLEKCVERGVPPGPLLGHLKQGEDVVLADGTTVCSRDVREPSDPGAVFIVVECPSLDYLNSLVQNPVFENYQRSTIEENNAFCIVHFTPVEVMKDAKYKEWMDKFGPSTINVILNERNDCTGSEAVHRMQHKLHLIHPKIFPLLNEQGFKVINNDSENKIEGKEDDIVDQLMRETSASNSSETSTSSDNDMHFSRTMHKIDLRPRKKLDLSSELTLQPNAYLAEAMADDRMLDALADLQTEINAKTKEIGIINDFPKLIFLGTGSCAPNKNRNTSGILLRIDENKSMLFDCGEGTLTQIARFYQKDEALRVLASIKVVYVSHLHADHHIGLIGLLKARERVTSDPVFLLAPRQLSPFLNFYDKRFESISNTFRLIPNQDLLLTDRQISADLGAELHAVSGLEAINTVYVRHVPNSFGVAVVLGNGYKMTYSGDTMPAPALVDVGLDSDLLIHEATMEDELECEALAKLHSTTTQALDMGKKMRARFILLTHFSQRYAKIPRLPGDVGDKIGIAFDNMEVRLDELPILPLLHPALKIMFSEACEELDTRAAKRKLRLNFVEKS